MWSYGKPKIECMLRKTTLIVLLALLFSSAAQAQQPARAKADTDTLFTDYDALFSELDSFLDSLLKPRDFFMVNLGIAPGVFQYEAKLKDTVIPVRRLIFSPSVSYFSKTGLGLSAAASIIRETTELNAFQFSLTGSYDYLKNRKFITGISFTRFFTKDSLRFYTSPLENTVYAYFTYRGWWLKPTVASNYGWGSRTESYRRSAYLDVLRLNRQTTVNTQESVNDFSLLASVRHDFYWLDVLGKNDYFRVTPQLTFVAGTQKFGFNQNSSTYTTVRGTGVNLLTNSEDTYLDNEMVFQPLSLTLVLKTEYSVGKFFIQPQVMLEHYFPGKKNNLSKSYQVNLGLMF